jgi:two-component system CheB/CheR fusion protein
LLRELMDQSHQEMKVQIYSTDLDADAIATARAGFYPSDHRWLTLILLP